MNDKATESVGITASKWIHPTTGEVRIYLSNVPFTNFGDKVWLTAGHGDFPMLNKKILSRGFGTEMIEEAVYEFVGTRNFSEIA